MMPWFAGNHTMIIFERSEARLGQAQRLSIIIVATSEICKAMLCLLSSEGSNRLLGCLFIGVVRCKTLTTQLPTQLVGEARRVNDAFVDVRLATS
jgi:hypothetical protein